MHHLDRWCIKKKLFAFPDYIANSKIYFCIYIFIDYNVFSCHKSNLNYFKIYNLSTHSRFP